MTPQAVPSGRGGRDPVLSIEDLRVDYMSDHGVVHAVDGVSLEIGEGEIFGLAGESGCGKSTVANAIMRLQKPPARIAGGRIRFQGNDVLGYDSSQLRDYRWRDVAMVFQSAMNALNPVMTIGAQIEDVFAAHGTFTRRAVLDRSRELLTRVGIDPGRLSSYPHQLSGGMRQRAVIAIALALQPRLLIMDEPTTALDVVVQREIMQQIADLQAEQGFSILFITHDMSLMVELSHRMAVMYAGRLVEVSSAEELFSRPQHPYSRALMDAFPPLTGPRRKLYGIRDAPPDMSNPPDGCRFNPRCPVAIDRCRTEDPVLRTLPFGPSAGADGELQVACHLAGTPEHDDKEPVR